LVGKKAGSTKAIQTRVKIHNDPPIYLFDTPGIFNPHVTTPIEGLKIALTGATNDQLTTIMNVADYLLFRLNNSKKLVKTWPLVFGLKEASDDIYEVASWIAKEQDFVLDPKSRLMRLAYDHNSHNSSHNEMRLEWDLDRACQYMVDIYREGKLGRLTLDEISNEVLEKKLQPYGDIGEQEMTFSKTGYSIEEKEFMK
jgi:ribosome biogenesis GTPase A